MTPQKVLEAIGGSRPVQTEEFATRAYLYTKTSRNPVKEVMDRHPSVAETPPLLGIFNDVPWYQFRENEAHTWARAGFSWIDNNGPGGRFLWKGPERLRG